MNRQTNPGNEAAVIRPWYKEPWPWVAISIPAAAVVMGFISLYLALKYPDYLVVEDDQYQNLNSELRAQQSPGIPSEADAIQEADEDGEH